MIGYNCDLETQKQMLFSILSKNLILFEVIKESQKIGLEDYFIGAGVYLPNGLELSKQHGFNVRNFRCRFCVF